jgi:ABC-2 type transport system ATP-binding protein
MLLSFQGIRKQFGNTMALADVTGVVEGRAVGLLGPNGAGKTTLMKVCLGLIRPDAGHATVLGVDAVANPVAVRARLGYAAEGPGRLPGLSGLESVAYAGELCGMRRRESLLRAHDMLDLVGLDESRYRPVETYSTGMFQRVKVAMALVHAPDLVLLDEPTSGLDPESRDELLDLVVHLRDHGGPAVLLSTHLLHDVERTCDAVMIMQSGAVRFAGPLSDLRVQRASEFDVRTAVPAPALQARLQALAAEVTPGGRPDQLRVRLPAGAGPELLWQAAASTGDAVVHLQARAASLEDAFLEAIGGRPALVAPPPSTWPRPAEPPRG